MAVPVPALFLNTAAMPLIWSAENFPVIANLIGRMSSCDCSVSFLSVKQDSVKLQCTVRCLIGYDWYNASSLIAYMRSSLGWMRSSLVVRASDCQCTSCNGPGFDPSIRRHSGIWGAADEAVLNIVRKKRKKSPQKIFEKKSIWLKILRLIGCDIITFSLIGR